MDPHALATPAQTQALPVTTQKKGSWWAHWQQRLSLRARVQQGVQEVFGADQSLPPARLILSHLDVLVRDDRLENHVMRVLALPCLAAGLAAAHWLGGLQFHVDWKGQEQTDPAEGVHAVKIFLSYAVFFLGALSFVRAINWGVWLRERRAPALVYAGLPLLVLALLAVPRLVELLCVRPLSASSWVEFLFRTGYRATIFWVTAILCVYALVPVLSYLRYLQVVYRPNLYFAYHLFRSLVTLGHLPTLPTAGLLDAAKTRTSFLSDLESAAQALEAFPRRYALASTSAQAWATAAYQGRARAVRELGRWFVLPRADTLPHLKAKLHALLQTAADGDWDSLEVLEASSEPEPPRWRRGLFVLRSVLLISVVPVAALFLGQAHFPGAEVATKYLSAAAGPWVALRLFMLLNPGLHTKLASFQGEVIAKVLDPFKK